MWRDSAWCAYKRSGSADVVDEKKTLRIGNRFLVVCSEKDEGIVMTSGGIIWKYSCG